MPVWNISHICAWADVWTCIVDMQENTKAGSITPFDSKMQVGPVLPRTPIQTHAKFSSSPPTTNCFLSAAGGGKELSMQRPERGVR